jgi:hypothetical protein
VVARAALLLALFLCSAGGAAAQTIAISRAGDAVKIRVPGWWLLDDNALARLKDGATVRVELTATALALPSKSAIVAARQVFSLSYDLWEERFAAAIAGARGAAASHLTEAAAAAWCVDQMAIPAAAIERHGGTQFAIRLEYRILDGDAAPNSDDAESFTLQRLIDVLSRRRKAEPPTRALDGGPFRLPPR